LVLKNAFHMRNDLASLKHLRGVALIGLGASLLSGCMVVPKTVTSYDPRCQVVQKHVQLEAKQVKVVATCGNTVECGGQLVFYGLVATSSAVISGSVAVVGNVVYWLEKQGQCVRGAPSPSPVPTSQEEPGSSAPASAAAST
jgi:hypothetical protein